MAILNPSFEDAIGAEWAISETSDCDHISHGRSVTWATEGTHCYRTDFTARLESDQHCESTLLQSVNLTGVLEIIADVEVLIYSLGTTTTDSYIDARISIDNNVLFEKRFSVGDSTGTYLYIDEVIDVAAYSGNHDLRLHAEVFTMNEMSPEMMEGAVMYDNLRETLAEPSAARHQRFTGGMLHRAVH